MSDISEAYNEGKAIPVTGHGGPESCEMLRFPHFLGNWLASGGRFQVLVSVIGRVDPTAIARLEGLGQLKYPITSSGIEPVTFWLVA
jgi:hypothetical protein